MLHSRTYTEVDDEVLRCLHGGQYKVLRYLVNRADAIGRCFPGSEAIGTGTAYGSRHVASVLPELADMGLIAYLRRGEYDQMTGRPLVNVYMVNPAYICLAELYQAEATVLWQAHGKPLVLIPLRMNHSASLTNTKQPASGTHSLNQFQETNTSHHHQKPTTSAKAEKPDVRGLEPENDGTANRETQDGTPQPTRRAASNRTKLKGSAAARLPNPQAVAHALPDDAHEKLALKLHSLGIRMALARGFVVEHGIPACQAALIQTYAASESTEIKSLPGFFRAMLQEHAEQITNIAFDDLGFATEQEVGY